MIKLLTYYNFILVTIMTVGGFLSAQNFSQLISAVLFYPFLLYFGLKILPSRKKAIVLTPIKEKPIIQKGEQPVKLKEHFDMDRRMFIRLVGSAGLTVFFLSIFTKKAHGAFFGSVPGPGTVALKDISGAQIDPAQHHPTQGYTIAQIDDASPSYYGYLNKNGAWFILKEDSSAGTYRYIKGSSSFATNWTNRASLTYDYFDAVF